MRFGVDERVAADGEVLRRPDSAELSRLAGKVAASRPEAVAICLLFSFAAPENERAVAAALSNLGVPLSLSHQILPEFREYERMSTVAVNAYLQPVMESYLRKLAERLGGPSALRSRLSGKRKAKSGERIFVMQSSGGITSLATAAREPVRTVLSGPAGGVVGAAAMARRSGFERIIGFDMGGTSTDVCLVDGAAQTTTKPMLPDCRCACRCSIYILSALVAVRSRALTRRARCVWDRNLPARNRGRSVTGAASSRL